MKPIEIICQDVFEKIRSRFQNLEMGDEMGAVTIDPGKARFFDFDFIIEGNDLGRVSISLNDLGSLKVYYSQGITEGNDDIIKKMWYDFLKEMRMFAMRRLLRFDTRDITKSNLDRNDFQYLANKKSKEDEMKQMNESKWNHKSTKKTSRAVRGSTEVIVRHKNNVHEMFPGARSQRNNIKAIFIQNKDGERFKYPFIHPAGAFAMAQHVDHGGIPHDPAGKAIIRMSENIAQLQEFNRKIHVQKSQLHDDAMEITRRAQQRLMELKSKIEALGKRHYYEQWISEFNESENPFEANIDNTTLEDYKNKFTLTNFQEELSKFFPLLHNIMQETNSINLEEFVNDTQEIADNNLEDTPLDDFKQFEQWAEAVEQKKLTMDQQDALKQALDDLQTPLDLDTAYNFFNEFGIDSDDLEELFQDEKLRPEEKQMEPLEVFKIWARENDQEDLLDYLDINTQDTMPPENVPAEPTVAPAAEVPPAPAQPAQQPGVMEAKNIGSMIKEVAKIVNQFYNREHKEQGLGPFPKGQEGICLEVQKRISEMYGEKAGEQASQIAEKFMQKIISQEQHHHRDSNSVADDGLARLRELTSLIKQKVEGIGDRGEGGKDFNNNIMPAEEIAEDLKLIKKLSGLAK